MQTDELYMQRCIDLARGGLGRVAPNPLVGAVVVHSNMIIGEGYHQVYGGAHAEVHAIASVKDEWKLREATIYVNLEPCCHQGKTPPCTDLILENNIPRVVVGAVDPFDEVAGKGIARLRSRGCEVQVGVLKEACRELNKRFFTFHEKKRPYIILKWAQTTDGFIDMDRMPGAINRPTWITSEKLRMLVHKWRTQEPVIMVGTQTALKDNPKLNVRDWHGENPLRIVLDQDLALPANLALLDNRQKTIIINEKTEKTQGDTQYWKINFDDLLLDKLLGRLYQENYQSVIVEGGRQLLQSFIDKQLWDEARIFTGSHFFGKGTEAPRIVNPGKMREAHIGQECFYYFRNNGGHPIV